MRLTWFALASSCLLTACVTLDAELHAARALYTDARYEQAQLWLLELDREVDAMSLPERTRFYYLRGMTAFRLGQRDDALHYLSLGVELGARDASYLPADWKPVMVRTLQELTPTDASSHARNPLGTLR